MIDQLVVRHTLDFDTPKDRAIRLAFRALQPLLQPKMFWGTGMLGLER